MFYIKISDLTYNFLLFLFAHFRNLSEVVTVAADVIVDRLVELDAEVGDA